MVSQASQSIVQIVPGELYKESKYKLSLLTAVKGIMGWETQEHRNWVPPTIFYKQHPSWYVRQTTLVHSYFEACKEYGNGSSGQL